MLERLKRVGVLFMIMCMLVTSMPMNVIAESVVGQAEVDPDNVAQIGNHYEVSQSDGTYSGIPELTGDTSVVDQADWNVKVDKTIAATGTENLFNVTLNVQTKTKIEEIAKPIDAAVVLVFDLSSSMKDPMENNPGTQRITAAKAAAQDFLDLYAQTTNEAVQRKVAIVGFDGSGSIKNLNGGNLAKGSSVSSAWYDASAVVAEKDDDKQPSDGILCDAIYNLGTGSGTNLESGLLLARNLLLSDALEGIEYKTVIVLSDGRPNRYVSNGSSTTAISYSGSDGNYHKSHMGALDAAEYIYEDLNVEMHTVFCGESKEKLHECNQTGCIYDEALTTAYLEDMPGDLISAYDTDSLTQAFKDIEEKIEIATQAWQGTDPMGTNGLLTGVTSTTNPGEVTTTANNLNWNLLQSDPEVITNDDGTKQYSYSVTYQVKLNTLADTFDHDTFYATNNPTKLDYYFLDENGNKGEDQDIFFNIPTVKGYKGGYYELMKIDDQGHGLGGATFTLTHDCKICTVCAEHDVCEANNDSDCIEAWSMSEESDEDGYVRFSNIPSGHTYTLTETASPNGYSGDGVVHKLEVAYGKVYVDGVLNKELTVVNERNVSVAGSKTWDDDDNSANTRPSSITVNLYGTYEKDDQLYYVVGDTGVSTEKTIYDSKNVTASSNWSWEWDDLPKKRNGEEIDWSIEEENVDGYISSVEGYNLTNIYSPSTDTTFDYIGTKHWIGDNTAVRPNNLEIKLQKQVEDEWVDVNVTPTWPDREGASWIYKFSGLAKFDSDGNIIQYRVVESVPAGYTGSSAVEESESTSTSSYNLSNTTSTTSTQTFNINTENNGLVIGSYQNWGDWNQYYWIWTSKELSSSEKSIVNQIAKETYSNFESSRCEYTYGNSATFTRQFWQSTYTANISVSSNVVTVTFNNNKVFGDNGSWTYGTVSFQSYTPGTTTLRNTYEPEETEATIKKVWDDAENQDGKRPADLRVTLSNGTEVTLNEANDWTATVEGLLKYADGEEIEYTWTEGEMPEGYELTDTSVEGTVTTLTNSYTPEETEATVKKVWDDAENQDGKRPVELKATLSNGTEVTLNAENKWTATVDNLPKYAAGEEIEYTWTEGEMPEGYRLTDTSVEGTVTTLTNSYTPKLIDIEGTKIWDDANNQDGKRPAEITINLLANGSVVDTLVVPVPEATLIQKIFRNGELDTWNWSFADLPKYADGEEIVYTVVEVEVPEGYTPEITGNATTGFTITNKHTPEKTEATIKKVWNDAENQDGKRPADLKVMLSDGTEVTLSEANDWTATVTELPKYKDGKEIEYTWTEGSMPEGYTLTDTSVNGTVTTLTNSYATETTSATVVKVWDDAENQDGKRPPELKVTLSNGTEVTLNEANKWTATVEGLPKYANGEAIEYTWTEETLPEGYELTDTSANGTVTTLTNSYEPEVTEATVKKVWNDANNQDGKRPAELKVTLSDGTEVTLNEGNDWTATVKNLPVYENGTPITYTWTEETLPEGYNLASTSVNGTVTTLTNSHTPEVIDIEGTKVWNDGDNQDGIRPGSIKIKLLANGEDTGKIVVISAPKTTLLDAIFGGDDNTWTWEFNDLPKYENGNVIRYTVEEVEEVEGYKTTVDGTTITNTHIPATTEATIKKVWNDANDQDGKRPESLTATLSDGTEVTLSEANEWTATVSDLPKYENGQLISYTWTEVSVDGYTLTRDVTDGTITTLTNTHVPETTEATITKVWDDAKNQDGKRPESLAVTLSDGTEVTLNEANNWTATVKNLPVYENGTEVTYTWTEGEMPDGYTLTDTSVKGTVTTLTNSYTPETTEATVNKVWNDSNNQDGKRPAKLDVTLSNGTKVTLNKDNNWTATVKDLPKYANGQEIVYTWTEGEMPEGYALSGSAKEGTVTTLTNSYTTETTSVTVVKEWNDANNQDGKRPESIVVTLSNGLDVTLTAEDSWTARVDNLPKYADGEKIVYTWTEKDLPEGYELTKTSVNGTVTTLTNSHTPELTTATVKKVWNDANDQDGKRPTSLTATLSNGTVVTLKEANDWTATVENLPKYANGEEITYSWTEASIDGYSLTGNVTEGTITTLTNTHTPETTEATIKKVWNDANDQDGKRPESLDVTLSNGAKVTLNEANKWTATVENLPKYDDGEIIEYTWTESKLPEGYALTNTETSGTITTLTNTHAPEKTEATIKKVWDDAKNQDGKRPANLTVTLSNGTEVTLNEANNWTATVKNLPVYENGNKITYTWTEGKMPEGYELTKTEQDGTITTLTNSYTPELTSATIKKIWNDSDNQDGKRPTSLTATLSNGTEVTLNEANGWTATVDNLPKYANGVEITYTWTEGSMPEGYGLETTDAKGTITTLTNKYPVEVTKATIQKVWDDAENQDGKRPASLTATLSNGTVVTLNEANDWTATVDNLAKYNKGVEIEYTWTEGDMPEGYTLTDTSKDGVITTLTNSYTPEKTEATIKKVWADAENQDGKRPESLTAVLSNGTEVTLNEANKWTATVDNLPKYADGKEIAYTWTEGEMPEGYALTDTSKNGVITTLTNSYTPELTAATIKKVWDDNNNQDGKRPTELKATLSNGTEVTLNEANGWSATVSGLPKYKDGKAIEYTWEEEKVRGDYELSGSSVEGTVTTLTNSHTPEVISIFGSKTWDDNNNQDGKRPAAITIRVLADGTEVTSKSITAADGWNWTFNNLPKYKDGKEIDYTITEDTVKDYTSSVDGYDVENTHVPEKVTVAGVKVWDDNNNQDGKRPGSIEVHLHADGKHIKDVTVSANDGWKYSFTDLPKYADGKEIVYTVSETPIDDYSTTITGYIITNTHTPGKTSVPVSKVWDDANNQDGIRPTEITVKLLADGVDTGEYIVLNDSNGWNATFTDLDQYKDGQKIAYTIKEDAVAGYTVSVEEPKAGNFVITNRHTPATTEVHGMKTWNDANDQDGKRPKSITITLYGNGKVIDQKVVTAANGWKWDFTGLPEKENGQTISYTIGETTIDGYTTKIDGYDVTNKYSPEKTSVKVIKAWNDANNQDGKRPSEVTVKLYADGIFTGQTVVLDQDNNWSQSFTDLKKYKNGGILIQYTVKEELVEGSEYSYNVTGNAETSFVITNSHKPETVTVSGAKTWDDNDDQDGKRPGTLTVHLHADQKHIQSQTVKAENGWTWTFENLPKYANGQEIVYDVVEENIPEYETTLDPEGYDITNKHAPEKRSLTVTKAWDDANNQDGMRPAEVIVKLLADGEYTGKTVVLSEVNKWSDTFTGLDIYKDGEEIVYTVEEEPVDGYTAGITEGYGGILNITNTHKPETIEISGGKTWNDANNQDGIRPAGITIRVFADGKEVAHKSVTAADDWKWKFTDLPKYSNGKEIAYTIEEDAVTGYTPEIKGFDVINTHEPATTEISGTKTWVDDDNRDGVRPDSIIIKLLADGVEVKSATVTETDGWSWNFDNLPVNKAEGQKITYSIKEVNIDEYSTVINGFNVTNTHKPGTRSVSVLKVWDDADNQDGKRPAEIKVQLCANDEPFGDEVTLNEANNWYHIWNDLHKNEDGKAIEYTVKELSVPNGYTSKTSGDMEDGYTITNSHKPEPTSVSGSKTWKDADNQDGKRPESLVINLYANGTFKDKQTVKAADGWAWTFDNLPKYEKGVEIKYTITEAAIGDYSSSTKEFDVTNTHTPEQTSVTVTKAWDDADNQDGIRPERITVRLFADGKDTGKTLDLTAKNNWGGTFGELAMYKAGKRIDYSVKEVQVDGYTGSIVGNAETGYVITNKHVPETIDISGNKTWDDADNQDGKRPGSITIRLFANGTEVDAVTVTEADDWSWNFTDLQKFASGKEIVYTITEDEVADYDEDVQGYDVTNTHVPETIDISGRKTWDDADNQDGKRPGSITIRLFADGTEVDSATVTESDNWTWNFTDLPKYAAGKEIVYTITEDEVADYDEDVQGYDVTNTHVPETIDISGSKTWDDADNQDGKRPGSITIRLFADGTEVDDVTVTEADDWAWNFTELPKYAAGKEIVYTITEDEVADYDEDVQGYDVTNTHVPETIDISGSKTWLDNDDQDGKRPESITIRLLADGTEADAVTVTEADDWAWNFTNLPKYADGTEIVYSITEDAMEDYSTDVEGYDVFNKHTPEQTSVTVTKAWDDSNNQDGIRPDDVTVKLLANGEETGMLVILNAENNWSNTFENLDVYADGEVIDYTVAEVLVDGYKSVISGDAVTGYVVTNSHEPAVTTVSGSKTWDDADNQDGKRPESITIRLLADGVEVDSAVVTEADDWAWNFTELDKFADGKEIVYTITEDAVEGYSASYDGYDVVNSYTPEQTSITVTKAWDDAKDQDGIRPEAVTVKLLADGAKTGKTVTLCADNNWSDSFEALDVYADGQEIVYTVEESKCKGYEAVYTGDAVTGFIITNIHEPEEQETGDTDTPGTPGKPEKPGAHDDSEEPAVPVGPGRPGNDHSEDDSDDGTAPYTGDGNGMMAWLALAMTSLFGAISIRRKKEEQ